MIKNTRIRLAWVRAGLRRPPHSFVQQSFDLVNYGPRWWWQEHALYSGWWVRLAPHILPRKRRWDRFMIYRRECKPFGHVKGQAGTSAVFVDDALVGGSMTVQCARCERMYTSGNVLPGKALTK